MSGFQIIGFDRTPMVRFSAVLGALDHFGRHKGKIGVIKDPHMINSKIVCVRVEDFGAVFRPDELDKLVSQAKRAKGDFPQWARKFIDAMQGASEDARYASQTLKKRMI